MSTETRSASVLDEILCAALAIGVLLVALLPAARGMSAVGWLPMWLVAMPGVAWWALHGFALPGRPQARGASSVAQHSGRRRILPQARRSTRLVRRAAARHAA